MIIDYPTSEFVRSVIRRYNPPTVPLSQIREKYEPNRSVKTLTVGFVGDICPISGRSLSIGKGLKEMLSSCDRLVGNFEGLVAAKRPRTFRLLHEESIFDSLRCLAPSDKWLLGVANNHAGDFGDDGFESTLEKLDSNSFPWFGTLDRPFGDLGHGIVLSAWSMWMNRANNRIPRTDPGPMGTFSIAYPHWGFEFVEKPDHTMQVPEDYDMVVAHHTHMPLPMEKKEDGRLIAWSLGNFCTGNPLKSLSRGAVVMATFELTTVPRLRSAHFEPISITHSQDGNVEVRVTSSSASSTNLTRYAH